MIHDDMEFVAQVKQEDEPFFDEYDEDEEMFLEIESIEGMYLVNGELHFMVRWVGVDECDLLVTKEYLLTNYQQQVFEFLANIFK
jgi:hypothetical protein